MTTGTSTYQTYDFMRAALRTQFNTAAAVMGATASFLRLTAPFTFIPGSYKAWADRYDAAAVMMDRITRDYPKPSFGLDSTTIDGAKVAVTEQALAEKPFGRIVRFKRDTDRNDPKVLIVSPMSGHFASLLRDTVAALLPGHDVHIVDWTNARDVPLSKGAFGLDDYNAYVQDFLRVLGPDTHVLAVCQPTVPVLGAISAMAKRNDPCQPLSMTLMAGPIDARANPTDVNRTATTHPMSWFKSLTMDVSAKYAGWRRAVYPGFMQLFAFMSMNPQRHVDAHRDMFNDLAEGRDDDAKKKTDFYDEYLATQDMTAEFYLETVERVFQKFELAQGTMTWRGEKLDPGAIHKTALFTVEGAKDDICGRGQTEAAHVLCTGLDKGQKYHYVQPGAGHYGVFSGRRWRDDITPRFSRFIRDIAERNNLTYSPAASEIKLDQGPRQWAPSKMVPELRVLHGDQGRNTQQNQAAGPSVLIG